MIVQYVNVLEYWLNVPAIMARLAFASGAAHRVGQLMEVLDELETREDKMQSDAARVSLAVQTQDGAAVAEDKIDYIELKDVVARPPVGGSESVRFALLIFLQLFALT